MLLQSLHYWFADALIIRNYDGYWPEPASESGRSDYRFGNLGQDSRPGSINDYGRRV